MKKNLRLFLLMLLISTSGLMVSCKDDDMESIVLKRSGNLRVSIKNGEAPVANTQIRFYNAETGNELDIVKTDENGVIDFGKLNEGNYGISFEVQSPYSSISQEFQVVSGENKEYSVQVKDYVGNLNVFLLDNNSGDLITEDLNVSIAIVPINNEFEKAFTNDEIIALATEIKHFGAEGKIFFENIPTGDYVLYQVLADTIVLELVEREVRRLDESIYLRSVNRNTEKLLNNHWEVTGASNYNTDEVITTFPMVSVQFNRSNNTFTMKLDNNITVMGRISYGTSYLDFYSIYTDDENISVSINDNGYEFDENGNLIIRLYSFRVYDSSTSSYIYDGSSIEIVLE